jgi:hypothetical protein
MSMNKQRSSMLRTAQPMYDVNRNNLSTNRRECVIR